MGNTSGVCSSFRLELLNGVHALGPTVLRSNTAADEFRAALILETASLDETTRGLSSADEVFGAGYTPGGIGFTWAAPQSTTDGAYTTPTGPLVWSNVSLPDPFDAVLLYNATQQGRAVAVYSFGSTTVVAGTFSLAMPVNLVSTALLRLKDRGVTAPPPPPTQISLNGPTTCVVGTPSQPFTIGTSQQLPGPVLITITPSNGTAAPGSVTLSDTVPTATFTYTASSSGAQTITLTNNGGVLNPAPWAIAAAAPAPPPPTAATALSIAGPTTCTVGQASDVFTISTNGVLSGTVNVTITPSNGSVSGSPMVLGPGNTSGTFTYTASSSGAKTLTVTNDGGLTNPSPASITATQLATPLTGTVAPTLNSRPFSPGPLRGSVLVFREWLDGDRYDRYQKNQILTGTTANMQFRGISWYPNPGGASRQLGGSLYTLKLRPTTFDNSAPWVDHASVTVTPNTVTSATFVVRCSELTEGWYEFDIDTHGSSSAGYTEVVVPFMAYVDRGGPAQTDRVPLLTDTYALQLKGAITIYWGCSPPGGAPAFPYQLTDQDFPSITNFPSPLNATIMRDMIVIGEHNATDRQITRLANGALTTFNKMPYAWQDAVNKYPRFPLLDGPRGVGNLSTLFHAGVDRHGGMYGADPWRIVRVMPDGKMVTRCGYRHRGPYAVNYTLINNNDSVATFMSRNDVELIGDWSAIPQSRWGFHEIWGLAWDQNSLGLDNDSPTQVNPTTGAIEHSHATNPRLFVTDSQNNRVLLLTFTKDSFSAEPVVTEFLTGLADPWDIAWHDDSIYVTERKGHRVAKYDATGATGVLQDVLVNGQALSTVDVNRIPVMIGSLYDVQRQDCVGPEGCFIQDGFLYFGSSVMRKVMKVNLTTKAVTSAAQQKPLYQNIWADMTAGSNVLTNVRGPSDGSTNGATQGAAGASLRTTAIVQGRVATSTSLPEEFSITDPRSPTPLTPIRGGPKIQSYSVSGNYVSTLTMTSPASVSGTAVAVKMYIGDDDLNLVGLLSASGAGYVKIAMSDGTFMPRGTILFTSWKQDSYAIRPDTGALVGWTAMPGGNWNVGRIPDSYTPLTYMSAIGVGRGRVYVGSSQSGVMVYRKVLPSDVLGVKATFDAGATAWMQSQHYMFYTQSGHGRFGYDPPWGESAAIDYYLTWNGLEQP